MIVIRQTEEPRPGAGKRTLVLSGSLSPVGELAFGGEQRAEVTWVSGSSVATVRLDGPAEDPTTANFRWRGHNFRRGEAQLDGADLADIEAVADALAAMRRDTALVEVDWDGVVRPGFIAKFEAVHRARAAIDAELEFQWVAPPNAVTVLGPDMVFPPSPGSLAKQMQATFDAGIRAVEKAVVFLSGPVEDVGLAVARVRENIARVSRVAGSLRDTAVAVQAVRKSMADGLAQVALACIDVAAAVKVAGSTLAQSDEGLLQMRASSYASHIGHAAGQVRRKSALELRGYRFESDLLGVHTCSEGDTLWGVSALWYGSGAHAMVIRRRNNLHSAACRAGQKLKIPRLGGPGDV